VPPRAVRTFTGQPGHMRRSWGPGWALVGDAGYFKDPLTAHGLTDALRDAELLARGIIAVIDGADERDALARYQMTRDALSTALFDVTSVIAGHRWTDAEIPGLLLQLNAAMAGEVQALAALPRFLPRRIDTSSSRRTEMYSQQESPARDRMRNTLRVGDAARRTRTVTVRDIELFTELTGDRNPLHYDPLLARRSRFGSIVVQGGVTSGLLNAVVAEDLPGPGSVFLHVDWAFRAPVRPGDVITAEVVVTSIRADKPVTTLSTTIANQDGVVVLDGTAVVWRDPAVTKG
jgi:acyl dehydratase